MTMSVTVANTSNHQGEAVKVTAANGQKAVLEPGGEMVVGLSPDKCLGVILNPLETAESKPFRNHNGAQTRPVVKVFWEEFGR